MGQIDLRVLEVAEKNYPNPDEQKIFLDGANCALDIVNELMCKAFSKD